MDQNETDGDTDRALIRTQYLAADAAAAAFNLAARATIQSEVDQNEADGDTDRALVRTEFAQADTAAATVNLAARAAIQSDVDQNETDGDTDRALIRTQYLAADAVVQAQVTANAALVASHTTSIATKSNKIAPSFTGVVAFDNNTIDNSTANRFKVNAQVFEFGTGSAETTLESKGSVPIIIKSGGPSSGTFEISGSANGDINLYPNGTGLVKINKGVSLSGLPTSDPGVAGQIYNDSGTLKISL